MTGNKQSEPCKLNVVVLCVCVWSISSELCMLDDDPYECVCLNKAKNELKGA